MHLETVVRALADPTRLRIMRLLAHMELAVGELAQVLGQSQPRVSRHIRILCEAGLADRRKEGSWVFLHSSISEQGLAGIGSSAASLLCAGERDDAPFGSQCAADRRELGEIRSAREKMAATYFARHAGEWDTLRSLHAADEPVEAALLAALGQSGIGKVLDIGTGTGRIAELVLPRAVHVTGLDNSPEMLRLARARLQKHTADSFDLVKGDFTKLRFADGHFETVLLHQVLHYAQAPKVVLAEAARVLRRGGRIAVVDFAAHDREELRERHAHARLGFGDEQMTALFTAAQFDSSPPVAIPGSPLTVKIWTGIRK